jgi:transposase-like protein
MAHRRPRRRFTREYKAQAVQRLMESGKPLAAGCKSSRDEASRIRSRQGSGTGANTWRGAM